jgi:hypothetical protein
MITIVVALSLSSQKPAKVMPTKAQIETKPEVQT